MEATRAERIVKCLDEIKQATIAGKITWVFTKEGDYAWSNEKGQMVIQRLSSIPAHHIFSVSDTNNKPRLGVGSDSSTAEIESKLVEIIQTIKAGQFDSGLDFFESMIP
jgi:hypothetical protein